MSQIIKPVLETKAEDQLLFRDDKLILHGSSLAACDVLGCSVSGTSLAVQIATRNWYDGNLWHKSSVEGVIERTVRYRDLQTANMWRARVIAWAYPKGPRTLHIIVNPTSGQNRGRMVWEQTVAPLLEYTPHKVEVHFTAVAGDATDIAHQLVAEKEDIIAAIGGDGTMSEIANGLMRRKDARRGQFTIAFIPAGTSNAMAHQCGTGDPLTAAVAMAKGEIRQLDMFAFFQATPDGTQRVSYGFLALLGAMIADIDIDSESCRCCGHARYTAYAVAKIFCCLVCCKPICPTHARKQYPYRLRWLPQNGASLALDDDRPLKELQSQPTPGGVWKEWEGAVSFFQLTNAPSIDATANIAPSARLNDGALHLQWRKASCCGIALLPSLLWQIASGDMPEPQWSCHKVQAVAADNLAPRSKIDLDGERMIDGAAWAAEVMPRFVNVIVGSSLLRAFDGPNINATVCETAPMSQTMV